MWRTSMEGVQAPHGRIMGWCCWGLNVFPQHSCTETLPPSPTHWTVLGRAFLPEPDPLVPDLSLPASITVRNTCLLLISSSLYDGLLEQPRPRKSLWFLLSMQKESTVDRGDWGLCDSWGALQVDAERWGVCRRSLQQHECGGWERIIGMSGMWTVQAHGEAVCEKHANSDAMWKPASALVREEIVNE